MMGKEGWLEAAEEVNRTMSSLPVRGAWADAAEEELRTGSGLEDTALSGRVEHIGTEVSGMLPGTDPADIKECALEFYREEV
jgi:hypothetical protein